MCLGSKLTNKVKKLIIYFFQRSGDTKCVLKIAEYTHCTVQPNRFIQIDDDFNSKNFWFYTQTQ